MVKGLRSTVSILALLAAALTTAATLSLPAAAQTQAAKISVDLPAQPLGRALTALADKAGLRLAFRAQDLAGKTAPALKGEMTADEALSRLLAGSGFMHRFTAAGAVTLAPVPKTEGAELLDPVNVEGRSQAPGGYRGAAYSGPGRDGSVAVLDQKAVERQASTRVFDAIRTVPNVTPVPDDFQPPIRGVSPAGGGGGVNVAMTTNVAPRSTMIIDGSVRPMTYANNGYQNLFDIESIQVFRGPQTTVRGPNALAGAFVVKTKDPSFQKEGAIETGFDWNKFSNFGYRGALMMNAPLVDGQVAGRMVVEYENGRIPVRVYDDRPNSPTSGAIFKNLSDFDSIAFRGKLLVQPKDSDFRAVVTGEYQTGRDNAFDSWVWGSDSWAPAVQSAEQRLYGYTGQQRIFQTYDKGVTIDATYAIGGGEIRSITAYHQNRISSRPEDNSTLKIRGSTKDRASQDLIYDIKGLGSFLDALFGVTASREGMKTRFETPSGQPTWSVDGEREALGVFTDLTIHASDQFRILAGGRLQYNTSTTKGRAPNQTPFDVRQDEFVVLPKFGVEFDVAPDHTVLATVRRGYNGGGGAIDTSVPPGTPFEYQPEYVWTYELGYRGALLDDRLIVGATVFYNSYKDYQFQYRPNPQNFRILNYDGTSYGAEVEARVRFTPTLSGQFGVGMLHTEIQASGLAIDGNRFGIDPRLTLSGGLTWEPAAGLSLNTQVTRVSSYWGSFQQSAGTQSGDYTNVDVGAAYEWNNISVRTFVRNAFDAFQYYSRSGVGGSGYVLPPRTFGATFSIKL